MKKRDKDDFLKKLMTRKEKGKKRPSHERGRAPKVGEDIVNKLDILISETRVKGETIKGMRPIQFMKWWGDFRPGDRVDVMFDEEYISMAGTNAEGHFAGVKKEFDIDDPTEMAEFRNAEGNLWNFV